MKSMWTLAASSFRECLRGCDWSRTLSSGAWSPWWFPEVTCHPHLCLVLNVRPLLRLTILQYSNVVVLAPCCLTEISRLLPGCLTSSTCFCSSLAGFLSLCSPLPDIYRSTGSVRQTLLVRTPLGSLNRIPVSECHQLREVWVCCPEHPQELRVHPNQGQSKEHFFWMRKDCFALAFEFLQGLQLTNKLSTHHTLFSI